MKIFIEIRAYIFQVWRRSRCRNLRRI